MAKNTPVLLRLPPDLAQWIKDSAAAEGVSVNAWATVLLRDVQRTAARP